MCEAILFSTLWVRRKNDGAMGDIQGALQDMGEVEVQHWLRTAAVRAASRAASLLHDVLDSFSNKPQPLHKKFEVGIYLDAVNMLLSFCLQT